MDDINFNKIMENLDHEVHSLIYTYVFWKRLYEISISEQRNDMGSAILRALLFREAISSIGRIWDLSKNSHTVSIRNLLREWEKNEVKECLLNRNINQYGGYFEKYKLGTGVEKNIYEEEFFAGANKIEAEMRSIHSGIESKEGEVYRNFAIIRNARDKMIAHREISYKNNAEELKESVDFFYQKTADLFFEFSNAIGNEILDRVKAEAAFNNALPTILPTNKQPKGV